MLYKGAAPVSTTCRIRYRAGQCTSANITLLSGHHPKQMMAHTGAVCSGAGRDDNGSRGCTAARKARCSAEPDVQGGRLGGQLPVPRQQCVTSRPLCAIVYTARAMQAHMVHACCTSAASLTVVVRALCIRIPVTCCCRGPPAGRRHGQHHGVRFVHDPPIPRAAGRLLRQLCTGRARHCILWSPGSATCVHLLPQVRTASGLQDSLVCLVHQMASSGCNGPDVTVSNQIRTFGLQPVVRAQPRGRTGGYTRLHSGGYALILAACGRNPLNTLVKIPGSLPSACAGDHRRVEHWGFATVPQPQ